MKQLLSLVILLILGVTQMFAQNCFNCDTTTKAFTIGSYTGATGQNSFSGGSNSLVTSQNAFAFGNNSGVVGLNGIALGSNALVNFANGIAIGNFVQSNAANSYVFGRNVTGSGSNSITIGIGSSSSLPLTNGADHSIMFGVSHLPSLTISRPHNVVLGYVGIGTVAPQEMAHVVGKLLIERTEESESSLQFKHPTPTTKGLPPDDSLSVQHIPYYWDIYSDTKGLKFNTVSISSNPTPVQLMVLSSGGRLGIGTATPLAKLHVDQNVLAEGNITTLDKFVLKPANNSTSEYWEISRTNNGLNYVYHDGVLRNRLFISNNGRIGIGQTDPSAILDVNGSFKAYSANITKALSAQSANITGNNLSNGFSISYSSTNVSLKQQEQGKFVLEGPGGGLTIATNGNVGVGKDPQEKLDVNGSLKAQNANITGDITADGTLNATNAIIKNIVSAHTLYGGTSTVGKLQINAEIPQEKALVINNYTNQEVFSVTGYGTLRTKNLITEEVGVRPNAWSDHVFYADYNLRHLSELEQYKAKLPFTRNTLCQRSRRKRY
jgi:hypothetical protein